MTPTILVRRKVKRSQWLLPVLLVLGELADFPTLLWPRRARSRCLSCTRPARRADRDRRRSRAAANPRARPAARLDYYSEYIDRARFPDPAYQQGVPRFPALEVPGPAIRRRHRDERIAARVHRRASRTSCFRTRRSCSSPSALGVATPGRTPPASIAGSELGGTLALAAALQPDIQHVFVVTGADRSEREYDELARQQFRAFESRLAITYLSGLPTSDSRRGCASLPAHSIVYYLVVDRDGAGKNFHPLEYLDRVTAVANAPIYSWVDSAMDHGIVGGSLKSQAAQTRAVGGLALRVLRGEPADGIPIVTPDLNVSQVDWRAAAALGDQRGARACRDARQVPGAVGLGSLRAYILGARCAIVSRRRR